MMHNNNGRLTTTSSSLPFDFHRNGGGEPIKRPLKKNAQFFQPTVDVFTLTVLLCVLSCTLTIALSYKWYADADRQINMMLDMVETVTKECECDVNKLTNIIRNELVAKRLRNDDEDSTTKATDYDDTDQDDVMMERFMGRDLFVNNWPTNKYQGAPIPAGNVDGEFREASEGASDEASEDRRRRRSAELDTKQAIVENQLNGSNDDKSTVESLQEDATEGNRMTKNKIQRTKKIPQVKKKVAENIVSYEHYELKETQNVPAAHFNSDKTKYSTKTHSEYLGNGYLRHPTGEFKDWKISLNNANHFQMENGKINITKPGIYYVYAQVNYSDQHDFNIYYIKKNNDTIFSCITTRNHNIQTTYYSATCYTGGLIQLNYKDTISIKGLYGNRSIYLNPSDTFFGIFQVSPAIDGKR